MPVITNSEKANKIIDWLEKNPIIKKSVIAEIIKEDPSYFNKMCRRERNFPDNFIKPVTNIIKKYGFK